MDNTINKVVVDQVFSDFLLCTATVHNAWEADDCCCAACCQPRKGVHDKGKVGFRLRCENASRRKTRIVNQQRVVSTSPLDGIGRIGNDQLKRFIVPMLRCGQRVLAGNIKLIKANVMQEHIDTAKVVSSDIDFLSIKAVSDGISAQNLFGFQKQRARAAGRVVDFIDFSLAHRAKSGEQFGNIRRGEELATGFSCTRCVHCHQIFIGIAKGINIMILHITKVHISHTMQKFCKAFISLCNGRTELIAVYIKIIEQSGEAAFRR